MGKRTKAPMALTYSIAWDSRRKVNSIENHLVGLHPRVAWATIRQEPKPELAS